MGLLDMFGTSWDDPKTMAALQLAGGLLGGQGNTMQRLAGGLNAYGATLGAAKRAQQDEEERKAVLAQRAAQELRAQQQFVLQQQLGGLQVNEAARAAAEREAQAARDDQFRSSIPSPQGQALRALGANASPTMANAERMPQVDPRSQFLFDALQARQLKPMDYLTATQKDTTPIKLGANERLLEPKTNRVLVDAMPDAAKMSPVAQLMTEMNALPPGDPRRAIYQNAISKATTHQPGVSVSYGAPVAGTDTAGNPVFFQPDKAGGQPNIVPGVKPPQKDSALTEAQAKATTFMSQMKAAEKELGGIPIDPTKTWSQVDVSLAGGLTNFAASPAAQRARQAQEQWSESFLRFKTGAAATKDEVILNVRTFFPQPGDSADVIEQKQRMRQQAVQDIAFATGQKATAAPPPAPAPKPTKRWNPSKGKFEDVGS